MLPMICFALFDFGKGEIILALAFILILIGRKNLSEFVSGLRRGIDDFRNASRQVTCEIREAVYGEHMENSEKSGSRDFWIIFALFFGTVCFIFALNEFMK